MKKISRRSFLAAAGVSAAAGESAISVEMQRKRVAVARRIAHRIRKIGKRVALANEAERYVIVFCGYEPAPRAECAQRVARAGYGASHALRQFNRNEQAHILPLPGGPDRGNSPSLYPIFPLLSHPVSCVAARIPVDRHGLTRARAVEFARTAEFGIIRSCADKNRRKTPLPPRMGDCYNLVAPADMDKPTCRRAQILRGDHGIWRTIAY